MKLGAIEAGGTKIVCGIGDETAAVFDSVSIPTGDPGPTLDQIRAYFEPHRAGLDGLGVASFGPVEVAPGRPGYGAIVNTPKLRWRGLNWLTELQPVVGTAPIALDTDVNAAAYGEAQYGAAKGLANCVYVTVGTGIGGGVLAEGQLVHGLQHPEIGHMLVRRHPDDTFAGTCPFHGDCLEGLASGPSLLQRWHQPGNELPEHHRAWDLEAYYLAQMVVNLTFTLSSERVILGGGVMHQPQLFGKVRAKVAQLLGGYIDQPEIPAHLDSYIVPPGLGDFAGLKGALALASRAAAKS